MTVLLGVDPGQTGALAALTATGALLWVEDMPNPLHGAAIRRLLDIDNAVDIAGPYTDYVAAVERGQAMPKERGSRPYNYGESNGLVKGALGALLIPYRLVSPAVWKRALGVTKDKALSRKKATELWPNHADLFRRVKDDGRAEAALIAYWLYEQTARRAA